jgi:hypothetical protein
MKTKTGGEDQFMFLMENEVCGDEIYSFFPSCALPSIIVSPFTLQLWTCRFRNFINVQSSKRDK